MDDSTAITLLAVLGMFVGSCVGILFGLRLVRRKP